MGVFLGCECRFATAVRIVLMPLLSFDLEFEAAAVGALHGRDLMLPSWI
jgi:hypothetical protein